MDEIEAVEWMPGVLDPAVHMRTAGLAGIALDRRRRVDNLQLVAVLGYFHIVARDDGDDGEGRPRGLPAFGAAAGVVVGHIALDGDLDRPVRALADKGAAGVTARPLRYAATERRVIMKSIESILLVVSVL